MVASEEVVCEASGTDAGDGEWHVTEMEKAAVHVEECMMVLGISWERGGCVFVGGGEVW